MCNASEDELNIYITLKHYVLTSMASDLGLHRLDLFRVDIDVKTSKWILCKLIEFNPCQLIWECLNIRYPNQIILV